MEEAGSMHSSSLNCQLLAVSDMCYMRRWMLAKASSSLFIMVPYSQGREHPSDAKQEKEWGAVTGRRPENAVLICSGREEGRDVCAYYHVQLMFRKKRTIRALRVSEVASWWPAVLPSHNPCSLASCVSLSTLSITDFFPWALPTEITAMRQAAKEPEIEKAWIQTRPIFEGGSVMMPLTDELFYIFSGGR